MKRSLHGTHHPNSIHRTGFSLWEVVLAVGLSLIVLYGVYGSLHLFWNYERAGQEKINESQIARAILHQISGELRSAMMMEAVSDESLFDLEALLEAEEETSIEVLDPAAAYTSAQGGLFGDATSLIVHIHRPQTPAELGALTLDDITTASTSSLRTACWFMSGADSGVQDLLQLEVEETPGLMHSVGDQLQIQQIQEAGGSVGEVTASKLIAPEVKWMTFRYFDGTDWWESWDSILSEALPVAVEVSLGFDEAATAAKTYSLVVRLPQADLLVEPIQ